MEIENKISVLLHQNTLNWKHLNSDVFNEAFSRMRRDVNEMPVVFLPEQSETVCVAENRMSSFGFLAFVVQSINAVVNVANNINNNNNNRNNNNNDNNNNQVNTNIANSANTQESMSMAGMMGRNVPILETLRQARDRVWATISGEPLATSNGTEPYGSSTLPDEKTYRNKIEVKVLSMMRKLYEEEKKNTEENSEKPPKSNHQSKYPEKVMTMLEKVKNHTVFYPHTKAFS